MYWFLICLKVLLGVYAVVMIVGTVYKQRRNLKFIWKIWSRFRVLMFFETVGMMVLMLVAGGILWLSVPFLNYGWTTLVFGKSFNIIMAPISDATNSQVFWIKTLPILFFCVLLSVLPFLAYTEEKIFRWGQSNWQSILKRSIVFGMVHAVMGIPITACIILIGAGMFYAWKYQRAYLKEFRKHSNVGRARKEALLESTTYHTLTNSITVLICLLCSILIVLN